ncbi:MAG: site-specific DNA-methyltransferase [Candidatus Muiribacteriota bacterium]
MNKTYHHILYQDSRNLKSLKDNSVDLIITSPPYPMIKMWDSLFTELNPEINENQIENSSEIAFENMHKELDKVWKECSRVLKDNRFICLNIGDSTRTVNNNFNLFSNHSRIIQFFQKENFTVLPMILWHKQTNSPNKFMGSGMLPGGAYVTLEHEYILIFRKNSKREFKSLKEKELRRESSFFWEERNNWFSDIWKDLKGVKQKIENNNKVRSRSAAFPFELAYRLINMYSVKNDTILDPFLGTGTTSIAAISSERNSIGVEYDNEFFSTIYESLINSKNVLNDFLNTRLLKHLQFVKNRLAQNKNLKYFNSFHNFEVMTNQETDLKIRFLKNIEYKDNIFTTEYFDENLQTDKEIMEKLNISSI